MVFLNSQDKLTKNIDDSLKGIKQVLKDNGTTRCVKTMCLVIAGDSGTGKFSSLENWVIEHYEQVEAIELTVDILKELIGPEKEENRGKLRLDFYKKPKAPIKLFYFKNLEDYGLLEEVKMSDIKSLFSLFSQSKPTKKTSSTTTTTTTKGQAEKRSNGLRPLGSKGSTGYVLATTAINIHEKRLSWLKNCSTVIYSTKPDVATLRKAFDSLYYDMNNKNMNETTALKLLNDSGHNLHQAKMIIENQKLFDSRPDEYPQNENKLIEYLLGTQYPGNGALEIEKSSLKTLQEKLEPSFTPFSSLFLFSNLHKSPVLTKQQGNSQKEKKKYLDIHGRVLDFMCLEDILVGSLVEDGRHPGSQLLVTLGCSIPSKIINNKASMVLGQNNSTTTRKFVPFKPVYLEYPRFSGSVMIGIVKRRSFLISGKLIEGSKVKVGNNKKATEISPKGFRSVCVPLFQNDCLENLRDFWLFWLAEGIVSPENFCEMLHCYYDFNGSCCHIHPIITIVTEVLDLLCWKINEPSNNVTISKVKQILTKYHSKYPGCTNFKGSSVKQTVKQTVKSNSKPTSVSNLRKNQKVTTEGTRSISAKTKEKKENLKTTLSPTILKGKPKPRLVKEKTLKTSLIIGKRSIDELIALDALKMSTKRVKRVKETKLNPSLEEQKISAPVGTGEAVRKTGKSKSVAKKHRDIASFFSS